MSKRAISTLDKALRSNWLQPRDREILVLLYKRKVLTPKQVWRIHSPHLKSGLRIFQNRLNKLEKNGLAKSYWYIEKHYVLTTAGAYLVADTLGITFDSMKWNVKDSIVNIEHYNGINEVGILLRKGLVNFDVGVMVEHKGWYFLPDATGTIKHNKTFDFYLEMDTGTQSAKIYSTTKVPNYSKAYRTKAYEEQYEYFPFVMITTKKGESRVDRIISYIENTKRTTDETYMITSLEMLKVNPYGRIWKIPYTDKKYSILDGGY